MLGICWEQKIQQPHPPPKDKTINHPNACHFTSLVAKKTICLLLFLPFFTLINGGS
jgi:hypothetical protein